MRRAAAALALVLLTGCAAAEPVSTAPAPTPAGPTGATAAPTPFVPLDGVTTATAGGGEDGLAGWQAQDPGVTEVTITSTADGAAQPAYWLPPAGDDEALLVVLHSWSSDFQRGTNAPYARWAGQRGWGMVAPDFRGANDGPESTGSALAVQDVLDAVDWAVEEGGVDPSRVYAVGWSGGGMMSLLAAGTSPETFAGVVAWAPVWDVTGFYAFSAGRGAAYPSQIEAACGGDPTADPAAAAQCLSRSPLSVADALREGQVPVYVATGDRDEIVPSSQSLAAFNALADPADALPAPVLAAQDEGVSPAPDGTDPGTAWFSPADPALRFVTTSAAVTLVVFDGLHDMVFNPGLAWLADLDGDRD